MDEQEVEAIRRVIANELGNNEVYDLVHTFRGWSDGGGEVIVEVWRTPDHDYTVSSHERRIRDRVLVHRANASNPTASPVDAAMTAHLREYRFPHE